MWVDACRPPISSKQHLNAACLSQNSITLSWPDDGRSVRYNETPSRGLLATIASEDKSFECHIPLSKVGKPERPACTCLHILAVSQREPVIMALCPATAQRPD